MDELNPTNYEKVFLHYQSEVIKLNLDAVAQRLCLKVEDANIIIPFFNKTLILNKKTGDVTSKKDDIDITEKLLALHHIFYSKESPRSASEFVSFREIRGLEFFDANYQRTALTPLAKSFDTKPAEFLKRGLAIGGTKENFGDSSFKLKAFPLIELIFVFWDGEDQIIPPAANIMFNKNIVDLLHLESIPVLAKVAVNYLR